jgi:hypothetical protein
MRLLGVCMVVALATPAAAWGAELMADVPASRTVRQGEVIAFDVPVHATGQIDCTVSPGDPATATFDTSYSLVQDRLAVATPSPRLPFYSDGNVQVLPPAQCGVAWDGSPRAYTVRTRITAGPTTPLGTYRIPFRARITNPGSAFFAPLRDDTPSEISLVVVAPKPELIGAPFENVSINLHPVRGTTRVRYPGDRPYIDVPGPIQVPPGTTVDTTGGMARVDSDATGQGHPQSAQFSEGGFEIGYTREVYPGRVGGRTADLPITELKLVGEVGPCGTRGARVRTAARAARGKRRRLWGNGKGRFRTRGTFAAGAVRGTHWLTEDSCDGTRVRVGRHDTISRVQVDDLVTRRRFTVRSGQSYLARPPDRRRGRTRG